MQKVVNTATFIQKGLHIHKHYYIYDKVNYINSNTKVCIVCPKHGEFYQTPKAHLTFKQGCVRCAAARRHLASRRRMTTEKFLNLTHAIHNKKYDYPNFKYESMQQIITIVCPIHGEFQQSCNAHLHSKTGCPNCTPYAIKMTKQKFLERARQKHGIKFDYSKIPNDWSNINSSKDNIIIVCPIHGEFQQRPQNHLRNDHGCKQCGYIHNGNKSKKHQSLFIKQAHKIHPDYDYSQTQYVNGRTKVCVICPKHGEFYQNPINHISLKQGCPSCNISHGEQRIYKWLQQRCVAFRKEYIVQIGGRKLRFDFYIPEHDVYVEYDGKQHFPEHIGEMYFNGKTFTFQQWLNLKERDDLKNEWCQKNQKRLLRINYKQLTSLDNILEIYFSRLTKSSKGDVMKNKHSFIIGEDVKWSKNGVYLRIAETVVIEPKSFANVEIIERFNMDGVFGTIIIDNEFHKQHPQCWHTAGLFDDGFGIGIEGGSVGGVSLYNMGEDYVTIEKGTRICQMVFFESDPAKKYNGFYNQNQTIKSQYEKSE